MPLIETLATTLATSIAKWVCGLWLGDGLSKEVASGGVDVLGQRIPSYLRRKQIERQFDQIAEVAAEKLDVLISAEFQSLAENERTAATHAASAAINRTRMDEFLKLDADPIRLKGLILQNNKENIRSAFLSADAQVLYEVLVRESCYYLAEIVTTLPPFLAQTAIEGLRRDTEIIDIARKVLARLPDAVEEEQLAQDRSDAYETDYRRFVAQKYDRLELFGLSFREISSRYALTVAYITLTVRPTFSVLDLPAEVEQLEGREEKPGRGYGDFDEEELRADRALADRKRAFIRGPAGSGKTTLLQWIAVRCARKEFDGPLESWNAKIPIMIQLRRFVTDGLPQPSDFLRYASTGISETVPNGWVHQQMTAGRVVLLIDGVDEIPEVKRVDIRNWISELLTVYPDCQYVVTSRPAAVGEGWLTGERFSPMELQPMTPTDIRSFVDHWHQAAARDVDDAESLSELMRYQVSLLDSILESPSLRNLATSPLLCAMLCALNRDRRTQIPKNRVELYRIALEMLLDRRDIERGFTGDEGIDLDLTQKTLLLRDYAYWLALNDLSDAPISKFAERLSAKLAFMPVRVKDGERVSKHLLVRSGLLRETVPGRVDYIHRTFQEYLAAAEVVAEDNLGLLVRNGDDDQWREIAILAAGLLGSRTRASSLINDLLERGDNEPESQHRLHLLAVACMETAQEVDPSLRERVSIALLRLLPPGNMTEARAVASAGQLALSQLAQFKDRNVGHASACIRTASLVGGEEALPVLAAFGNDHRVTVQKELIRAWSAWPDPVEFAERVLTDSPLRNGELTITDSSLLPAVSKLKNLASLNVVADRIGRFGLLSEIPQVRGFTGSYRTDLSNIEFLRECWQLEYVDLESCFSLSSIDALAGKVHLGLVDISRTDVSSISPLSSAERLTWLGASRCKNIQDWSSLSALQNLRTVHLTGNETIVDLDFIGRSSALLSLSVSACRNLRSIEGVGDAVNLASFWVTGCWELDSIDTLSRLRSLRDVGISGTSSITSIEALAGKGLRNLVLSRLSGVDSLRGLQAEELLTFNASFCENLRDISALHSARHLFNAEFEGTDVRDLSHLEGCVNMLRLNLSGSSRISSLEVVASMPHLRVLDLRDIGPDVLATLDVGSNEDLSVVVYSHQDVSPLEKRNSPRVRISRVPDRRKRSS